jgi:hypothetical protein
MRVLLVLLLLAGPALAQEEPPPFAFGSQPGWTLNVGGNCGGSFGTPGGGGFAGAELSLNRLLQGAWMGLYGDAVYDFGWTVGLLSAGPQIGYGIVGVDAGGALLVGRHGTQTGAAGRVLLSAGVVAFFGRYAYLFDSEAHLGQVGILVKLPVWASL